MNSASIIELHQIKKTYLNQIVALKTLSFSVFRHEFVAVAGGNGSGKSTLLKIITGQLKPDQGRVEVFQRNAFTCARQLTHEIGYVSQDWALDPDMNGTALLHFFAALYGLSAATSRQRLATLIADFDMQAFIARRISTYSGGQMQRLHLAIGIIHQPKLLILDEPTNSLDPSATAFLWHFLKAYQESGNTLLVVSHDLDRIQRYCSRVILFEQGQIVADDTPAQLVRTYSQPMLHIKTADPVHNQTALASSLRQLAAEVMIHSNGQTVTLLSQETDKAKLLLQVLQVFAGLKQTIAECRWEEPGLAQAYTKLTGLELAKPKSGLSKKHKSGSRKRH